MKFSKHSADWEGIGSVALNFVYLIGKLRCVEDNQPMSLRSEVPYKRNV